MAVDQTLSKLEKVDRVWLKKTFQTVSFQDFKDLQSKVIACDTELKILFRKNGKTPVYNFIWQLNFESLKVPFEFGMVIIALKLLRNSCFDSLNSKTKEDIEKVINEKIKSVKDFFKTDSGDLYDSIAHLMPGKKFLESFISQID
eukprot:TRINITY_DN7228_c1_g1_i1.p1 TRINITY_DN7228_c1_g1~~TRINITY_DN7228_c1_g1_i1.p1  ORF type:complete len:145 (-),score=21.26 TRINITY_DN7228_c1_g1_i1:684-1118(-)